MNNEKTITHENLLAAGYKTYPECAPQKGDRCVNLYQKRIEIDGSPLFYLNFWRYNTSGMPEFVMPFSADVQFNCQGGAQTFNVALLLRRDTTIKSVEDFYVLMWRAMVCDLAD